jgi:hypothetical protein
VHSVHLKRPLPHHLIIVSYIATPLVNLLLVSLSLGIPLGAAAGRVLAGYGPLVTGWMVTAPIAGACLYLLNRASWYIFLAHACIILAASVVTLGLRWLGDVSAIPRLSQALFLLGNVARIAFVAYVLQRDFRAPYLHILKRSFRGERRFVVRVPIGIDGETWWTGELSVGGCFVEQGTPTRSVGERVQVLLACGTVDVQGEGEVMRSVPGGLGVRFMGLTHEDRRALRRMLSREVFSSGRARSAK